MKFDTDDNVFYKSCRHSSTAWHKLPVNCFSAEVTKGYDMNAATALEKAVKEQEPNELPVENVENILRKPALE